MKHFVDDQGRVQSITVADLPSEEYVHAAVVDSQPITLEDVIRFLLECKPAFVIAFRMVMVITWMYLVTSLVLGKF